MKTSEHIRETVDIEGGALDTDFHNKLAKRLDTALKKAGMDSESMTRFSDELSFKGLNSGERFSDTYTSLAQELEKHICLSSDYEIDSHRKGVIGAVIKFLKSVVMKIKLKTDVQVSQQAKFNSAAFVAIVIMISQLDVGQKQIEENNRQIASLREELAICLKRLDGR